MYFVHVSIAKHNKNTNTRERVYAAYGCNYDEDGKKYEVKVINVNNGIYWIFGEFMELMEFNR